MSIFTPTNQIRLTNVAIMRYKRGGKRFELACYPNKVTAWRDGLETDIDAVLQIDEIFLNVSKGDTAKADLLEKCFETTDKKEIIKTILSKGQLQLGQKERDVQLNSMYKDVAAIIAEKCVNPETQRPVTQAFVERAMKEQHINLNLSKAAKKQALVILRKLEIKYPKGIKRAQMKIKIITSNADGDAKKLLSLLKKEHQVTEFEKQELGPPAEIICLVNPGSFRGVDESVKAVTKGEGKVEVLSLAVAEDGDASIESLAGDESDEDVEEKEKAPKKGGKGKKAAPKEDGKEAEPKKGKKNKSQAKGDEEPLDEEDVEEKAAPAPKKKGGKKKGQAPPSVEDSDEESNTKDAGAKKETKATKNKRKKRADPIKKQKGQGLPPVIETKPKKTGNKTTTKKKSSGPTNMFDLLAGGDTKKKSTKSKTSTKSKGKKTT